MSDFFEKITKLLQDKNILRPNFEASLIICEALALEQSRFLIDKDNILSNLDSNEINKIMSMVLKRLEGCPLDYVLGNSQFYGRKFYVGSGCLIPRTETESLVEWALKIIKNKKKSKESKANFSHALYSLDFLDFLDWGTGSGCIAATLALELPLLKGCALDISEEALKWARRNFENLGVSDRIKVYSDINDIKNTKFDMIIANPPYIPTEDVKTLDAQVKDYEPMQALDGSHDGMSLCRQWLAAGANMLAAGGFFLMETAGKEQCEALSEIKFSGMEYKDAIADSFGVVRFVRFDKLNIV